MNSQAQAVTQNPLSNSVSSLFGMVIEEARDWTVIKAEDGLCEKIGKWTLGTAFLISLVPCAILEAAIEVPLYFIVKTSELIGSLFLSSKIINWLRNECVNPLQNLAKTTLLYIAIGVSRIFTRAFGDGSVHATDRALWNCFPHLQLDTLNDVLQRNYSGIIGILHPQDAWVIKSSKENRARIPADVTMPIQQMVELGKEKLKLGDESGLFKTLETIPKLLITDGEFQCASELVKEVLISDTLIHIDQLPNLLNKLIAKGLLLEETTQFINNRSLEKMSPSDRFSLFKELIEKNLCLNEAIQFIKEQYQSPTAFDFSFHLLVSALVEKGEASIYQEALDLVQRGLNRPGAIDKYHSRLLLEELVRKGTGFEVAIEEIQKGLSRENLPRYSLERTCIALIDQNQYIPDIEAQVDIALRHADTAPKINHTFNLLNKLIKKGVAIEIGIRQVNDFIDTYSEESLPCVPNIIRIKNICYTLIDQERNYPKFIEFSQKLMASPFPAAQLQGLKLLRRLVQKGQAIEGGRRALTQIIDPNYSGTPHVSERLQAAIEAATRPPERAWYQRLIG